MGTRRSDEELSESESIQRELWRLGLLLTGSGAGATAALVRVLRGHENVRKLSEDRRRRLVVMGAREWLASGGAADADAGSPAGRGVRLATTLEALPREAWVLREVKQWGEVEVSRAMGVARSAIGGYAEAALSKMRGSLGAEYDAAVGALRTKWGDVEAGAGVEAARRDSRRWMRRKRVSAAVMAAVLLAVMALIAWIGRDLQRASERERSNKALGEAVSNPMPAEEARKSRGEGAR